MMFVNERSAAVILFHEHDYVHIIGIQTHDPNQGWGVVLIDFVIGPGPLQRGVRR
jgi:hypothetical protein